MFKLNTMNLAKDKNLLKLRCTYMLKFGLLPCLLLGGLVLSQLGGLFPQLINCLTIGMQTDWPVNQQI